MVAAMVAAAMLFCPECHRGVLEEVVSAAVLFRLWLPLFWLPPTPRRHGG